MGKRLAIKGHPTRGEEVIKLLGMMGGENKDNMFFGKDPSCIYFIDGYEFIRKEIIENNIHTMRHWQIFTLEEFLEKYPFKVRDFVRIPEYESELCILKMKWCPLSEHIEYMVWPNDEEEWFTAEELLEYNDKPSPGEITQLEKTIEKNNKTNHMPNVLAELLDHIKNTSKEELEKEFNELEEWSHVGPTVEEFMDFCNKVNKKPKYPKLTNLTECKEILGEKDMYQGVSGYKGELLTNFQRLIIFRDVYWKIAGEEMGLDKPWEPDWLSGQKEEKYCIATQNNEIWHNFSEYGGNEILAFPTIEMRDAFYENFKDLIESCKELL